MNLKIEAEEQEEKKFHHNVIVMMTMMVEVVGLQSLEEDLKEGHLEVDQKVEDQKAEDQLEVHRKVQGQKEEDLEEERHKPAMKKKVVGLLEDRHGMVMIQRRLQKKWKETAVDDIGVDVVAIAGDAELLGQIRDA